VYEKKFTRKKPAYENCIITDPNGEPLRYNYLIELVKIVFAIKRK